MYKEEKFLFNQTEFYIERKFNISTDSPVRVIYEVTGGLDKIKQKRNGVLLHGSEVT